MVMQSSDESAESIAYEYARSQLKRARSSWRSGDDATAISHVLAALDAAVDVVGIDDPLWILLHETMGLLATHGHMEAAKDAFRYFERVAELGHSGDLHDPVWDRMLGMPRGTEEERLLVRRK